MGKINEAIKKGIGNALEMSVDNDEESFSIKKHKASSLFGMHGKVNKQLEKLLSSGKYFEAIDFRRQYGGVYIAKSNDDLKRVISGLSTVNIEDIATDDTYIDLDWINTKNVTNMSYLFRDWTHISIPVCIDEWDVSKVTNMNSMFAGNVGILESMNLNKWDVSKVVDMTFMFKNTNFVGGKIDKWNVSNVTHMVGMFEHCYGFKCDISSWDVSNVVNMYKMFKDCSDFDKDLSNWDISKVKNTNSMFKGCEHMNESKVLWDLSNVINKTNMF